MTGTVRVVDDGEEVLLSAGQHFRVRPRPGLRNAVTPRLADASPLKGVDIQYVGFQDVEDRREYALRARRGAQEGSYTVSIKLAAFANRQALLQDGPDICYQKLLHELTGSELHGASIVVVTDGDLAAYRESHAPPQKRRSFSAPRPAEPSKP